jgi:hypothetical protein
VSSPWRRFLAVVGFEAALLVLAASLGRVPPLLLTIVIAAAVIETFRLVRALRRDAVPAPVGPVAAAFQERESVCGAEIAVEPRGIRSLDDRIAEAEQSAPHGPAMGAVPLEHPDELVPYIDVEPDDDDEFNWVISLYDEVRLFVDDDALSEAEGGDPLELRFARAAGITGVLREDREQISIAAPNLSARQLHAVAVAVLADAAQATQRLGSQGG